MVRFCCYTKKILIFFSNSFQVVWSLAVTSTTTYTLCRCVSKRSWRVPFRSGCTDTCVYYFTRLQQKCQTTKEHHNHNQIGPLYTEMRYQTNSKNSKKNSKKNFKFFFTKYWYIYIQRCDTGKISQKKFPKTFSNKISKKNIIQKRY
jgi:hypothetical protein